MQSLYNVNGLMFWTQKEIKLRNFLKEVFADEIKQMLLKENKSWQFFEIEAPILMPVELMNKNYTNEDVWIQQEETLVLRPETTPSSYVYMQHLLKQENVLPPFVVYQSGKSFRKEQDQVSKNMRLKEFYQQEFQCVYTSDTFNDYQTNVLEPISKMISKAIGLESRVVESDRLPSYSLKTMDVEVFNGEQWMEICSISKRIDFPDKVKFNKKGGDFVERDLLVLEIAIGLDRCVYNYYTENKITVSNKKENERLIPHVPKEGRVVIE